MRAISDFLARWTALALLVAAAGAAGGLAVVTSVRSHRIAALPARPRIVPDRSTNWVGYVFLARHVTGVRAEWVEPDTVASKFSGHTYQPTGPEAAAVWLGVGGDLSTDIMQAGTEAYLGGPYGVDEAWYERFPLDPHQVNSGFEVFGEDVIRGSIALVPGSASDWRVSITETGTGVTWSRVVHYNALLQGRRAHCVGSRSPGPPEHATKAVLPAPPQRFRATVRRSVYRCGRDRGILRVQLERMSRSAYAHARQAHPAEQAGPARSPRVPDSTTWIRHGKVLAHRPQGGWPDAFRCREPGPLRARPRRSRPVRVAARLVRPADAGQPPARTLPTVPPDHAELLPRAFFDRTSTDVAPELLGCVFWSAHSGGPGRGAAGRGRGL